MTKAGYIFTGINVLLALIFGLLLSSVASTRLEGQKKIDGLKKQIEDGKKAVVEAEKLRAKVSAELTDARQLLASENRAGDALKSEWDNRLTRTTDLLQDSREANNSFKQTLSEIQLEVTARADEAKKLEGVLAQNTAAFDALAKQTQQVAGRLENVEKSIRDAQAKIAANFKIVAAAESGAAENRMVNAR